ncbi:MAG: hypothetical protein ISR64_05640 [Deltaproteobacteria bacterium]|nr:hypothetical protein [Deltaproteobacteria bacterium]
MTKTTRMLFIVMAVALGAQVVACKKPREAANAREMKEKLSDKVGWGLWKIDATEAQEAKTDKMLDELAPDLFRFQQESKAIKRGLIRVFMEDEVVLEKILEHQKAGLDLFDRYTRRMSRAGVEAADILTREQRLELVNMWRRWEFGED